MKNMKSKISKILGVGLMVAMLASMFVVGTPASAAVTTLGIGNHPEPDDYGEHSGRGQHC